MLVFHVLGFSQQPLDNAHAGFANWRNCLKRELAASMERDEPISRD
jgi:hypothetical protein